MNIEIDKFTPCLQKTSTGEIVDTSYSSLTVNDLNSLKKWQFNWKSISTLECEIYKLTVSGDDRIQGVVAIENMERDKAIYVRAAESAPHNMGTDKEYYGVGGHLFAVAVTRSFQLGYDGFTYMDAKNITLVKHYTETLGAFLIGTPHPYRMVIDEAAAGRLISYYNFRRG